MALPLGKLTLIVGAGLVGSVLAKEGRLPAVPDFFTGAFKIVWKQLRQDESVASCSRSKNDSLLQQVNSLRQELQLFSSNRSVTIVTGDQSGSGKYGVIVVVVVVGYGYIWWKGWKLSDMMFATKRGLNDACGSVAKQLENVYSSVSSTRKHLSSRIDRVDCKVDECADNTAAMKEEVSELRSEVKLVGADVSSVHYAVQSLETKINRIEGRQNETTYGVGKLVAFVRNLENSRHIEPIEGSASKPALEFRHPSPSRSISLPNSSSVEPVSPSTSNGYQKKRPTFVPADASQSSVYDSGLKELYGISETEEASSTSTPDLINMNCTSEETNNATSGFGILGRKFSGISVSLLTRSRSAMQSFK